MDDPNFDIKVAIEETRLVLERTYSGLESAKSTARSILSAASLVVSLLGALQLTNAHPVSVEYVGNFNTGLIVSMIAYVALIACCVYVLWPASIYASTEAKWETIRDSFVGKNERDILKQQLSGMLNAISLSEPVITRRWKVSAIAGVLIALIVVLLLLLATIPRM